MILRFSLRLVAAALSLFLPSGLAYGQDIRLLECLSNGVCTIQTGGQRPLGVFQTYFNNVYPLILGSAAGIALLWALVGGIEIMVAGENASKRTEGVNRLMHALTGLVMLLFAAVIMNFINPTFYR